MRRLKVNGPGAPKEAVAAARKVLRAGGLVAFPTETVYGLCVDATIPAAVKKLYAAKGRDMRKACAVLVASRAAAEKMTGGLPSIAARLADHFWPGPVTLVVPGRRGNLVGLRLPRPALPRAIARAVGRPLLQTSANRAGQPAALNGAGVVAALGDEVDLLLDTGRAPGGQSSTVVRCDGKTYAVLREGAVPTATIADAAERLIMIVCTGNLCRSPVAEVMMRDRLAAELECETDDLARHGFRVESFGTMGLVDKPATDHSVTVAAEHGLDLGAHRSRPFSHGLINASDTIFCLARGHREFLIPYLQERPDALQMLHPKGKEIHDPYGRSLKVYRKTGEQIAKAVSERAKELAGTAEEEDEDE